MTSLLVAVFLLLQSVPRQVTGRVSVEGGAPYPSSFTLQLMPVGAGRASTLAVRLQIDGTFRVVLLPGEYRVGGSSGLPAGYTLKSIAYGGVDLLRNPLKIAADDSADLLIELAVNGPPPVVSVSGRVTGIAPGQFR